MCFFNTPFNVCSATITIICFSIIRSQTGFLFECWFFVVVAGSFGVDFCFAIYLFILQILHLFLRLLRTHICIQQPFLILKSNATLCSVTLHYSYFRTHF